MNLATICKQGPWLFWLSEALVLIQLSNGASQMWSIILDSIIGPFVDIQQLAGKQSFSYGSAEGEDCGGVG